MLGIPAFIPNPVTLAPNEWEIAVHESRGLPYGELCTLATIAPRVSGPALSRTIFFSSGGIFARKAEDAWTAMLGLPFPSTEKEARIALGYLAYGHNDYAAREAVCGRGYFKVAAPPGRRRTGKALSAAARVRAHRAAMIQTQ